MWDASDEAILAGVAAGDETAMLVFVRRFQRRLFGLAMTMLRDEGHAADVAQEAFVRAWRNASSFDARRGTVVTWLLAITRNAAIDRLRMDAVRPVDPIDPAVLVRRPVHARDRDEPADVDEIRRVLDAVAELSEAQRRCVILSTLGGYTAREISVSENIPIGTAKTRLRDGLRRVRAILDVRPDDVRPDVEQDTGD